jgi:hypothetical protein
LRRLFTTETQRARRLHREIELKTPATTLNG